jgi:hypothetical protein
MSKEKTSKNAQNPPLRKGDVMGSASPEIKKEDDKYEGYHKCPNCGIRHGQINDHINHMELCNMVSFYY